MRRTRMMLATAVVALSLSASGTGVALAQSHEEHGNDGTADVAEQCRSYNFFEWLFHHECHGHTAPFIVYWPA